MRLLHKTTVLAVLSSSNALLQNQTSRMFASSRLLFQHFDTTDSTQDVAKQHISTLGKNQVLTVTASEQTKGRGTSGRTWMGLRGNVFLTMALTAKQVPTTLTLLPLKVGILVAERVDKLLKQACHTEDQSVKVKWPNDVLVNEDKIAGILIESQVVDGEIWLLVGVGVNLVAAPSVPTGGPNRGRTATAIQKYCTELPETTAQVFAQDFAESLVQWLEDPTATSKKVRDEWKSWANLGQPQVLRDTNEEIVPLDLKEDGQLVVRGEDGKERLLVAEYLF